jgi:hypothetical protein
LPLLLRILVAAIYPLGEMGGISPITRSDEVVTFREGVRPNFLTALGVFAGE